MLLVYYFIIDSGNDTCRNDQVVIRYNNSCWRDVGDTIAIEGSTIVMSAIHSCPHIRLLFQIKDSDVEKNITQRLCPNVV